MSCCVVSGCIEMFTNQTDHLLNTHCTIVLGVLYCHFSDCHVTCYDYHVCSCHTHDKPDTIMQVTIVMMVARSLAS